MCSLFIDQCSLVIVQLFGHFPRRFISLNYSKVKLKIVILCSRNPLTGIGETFYEKGYLKRILFNELFQ